MSRVIRIAPLGSQNLSQWFTVANGRLEFAVSTPAVFKDGTAIDCHYLTTKGLLVKEYTVTASTARITPKSGEMPYRYWKRYSLTSPPNQVILGIFTRLEKPLANVFPMVYVSGFGGANPILEIKVYSRSAEAFKLVVKILTFSLAKVS